MSTTSPTRHRHARRIGIFVVAGLGLVVAGVLATAGGTLFTRKDHAVMHFSGSVYGLQVGAPVVFRGVRLGSVTAIGLAYDAGQDAFTIPVTVDLDRNTVRQLRPDGGLGRATLSLPALIDKGLRAQLSMQSLLTGQLYVDLDLRPARGATGPAAQTAQTAKEAQAAAPAASAVAVADATGGVVRIPTTATAIQNLKAQLDSMDFRQLLEDVSSVAAAARQVATGPALARSLTDLRQLSAHLNHLSARLDRRIDPLADAADRTLADSRRAVQGLGHAADAVRDTAQRLGGTADRASALLASDSPTLASLQRASQELALTAAALRAQADGDAPLAQNLNETLRDVGRAARAVRQLAEQLDDQPQSLLRGRAPAAAAPVTTPGP